MKYGSIADIYAENERVRARLNEILGELSDEGAAALPEGEKWSIAMIVEHVSLVDEGISKICGKLISKAKNDDAKASGSVNLSPQFFGKSAEIATMKLEAPEFVQPGGKKTIAESMEKMAENRQRLVDIKPLFEAYDGDIRKFPHPFFGDLSAVEWLVLIGGHEARHIKQIEIIIERMKN